MHYCPQCQTMARVYRDGKTLRCAGCHARLAQKGG